MKKLLVIFVAIAAVASMAFGQMAYKMGDQVISVGIGIGGVAGVYGSGGIAISGGYENALTENISLGGLVGYSSSSEDVWAGYGWDYTYILIGARGAYHGDLFHDANLDTYGGIILGYNIVSSSAKGTIPGIGWGVSTSGSSSYMVFGAFIGTRYYFDPSWAVQAELGYGIGILNIGIAYKF